VGGSTVGGYFGGVRIVRVVIVVTAVDVVGCVVGSSSGRWMRIIGLFGWLN